MCQAEFPKEGVVVGDIYFVQKADDPTALTTVMVEVVSQTARGHSLGPCR